MNQIRATAREREAALNIHRQAGEINIDDGALVVHTDEGTWVQAWVFVSNETLAASNFGELN